MWSGDDLHDYLHETHVPDKVPYQCTVCGATAWTRREEPKCGGFPNEAEHRRAPMVRVDGNPPHDAVKLW